MAEKGPERHGRATFAGPARLDFARTLPYRRRDFTGG
jgi:hypothetical protein